MHGHTELKIQIPLDCLQHNTTCREKETAEHNIEFSSTALAYPEGELRGSNPPIKYSEVFLIVCLQIYYPSSAPILIKSQILYRKTLKIVC